MNDFGKIWKVGEDSKLFRVPTNFVSWIKSCNARTVTWGYGDITNFVHIWILNISQLKRPKDGPQYSVFALFSLNQDYRLKFEQTFYSYELKIPLVCLKLTGLKYYARIFDSFALSIGKKMNSSVDGASDGTASFV